MKKVAFCTLGCKVNQYETELMEKQLEKAGYTVVDFENIADIYVINSCTVTNLASRKSRQMLSRAKRKNPYGKVILSGCYSEEIKSGSEKINNVDLIIGNEEKKDIVDIIEKLEKGKVNIKLKDISKVNKYVQKERLDKGKNVRESIKIEDGCNNFCSYCIIPYTRGRIRSRKMEDILKEVREITKTSVKEIVLVGIEIASYGQDLGSGESLASLVEKINEIDTVRRIRLGSIDPRWLTEENIARLSKVEKLCNHFHISVQSLSSSVLKRMNRKYTQEFVKERIEKIRKYFSNPLITCDIIVGFVNETDEEFRDTYEAAKEIGFSDMHIFKYSRRKGTAAYNLESTVTEEKKIERSKKLEELSIEMKQDYLKKELGKTVKVLIDERKAPSKFYGYTSNYLKVEVRGDDILWGEIQDLELTSIEGNTLIGRVKQK